MLLLSRWRFVLCAICLGIACAACESQTEQKQSTEHKQSKVERKPPSSESADESTQPAVKSGHKTAQKPKAVETPPPSPTIPQVLLTDALRAACVVGVGDKMPDAELPDLSGNLHNLSSLHGQKLTVVCVWTTGDSPRSRLMTTRTLKDLVKGLVEPFGEKGVRLVGINVGESAAAVQQHMADAGATFATLLDPKGELYAKLAKDQKMPRAYLLDSSGKILWFDVELPRDSLRDLAQGIRVALGER